MAANQAFYIYHWFAGVYLRKLYDCSLCLSNFRYLQSVSASSQSVCDVFLKRFRSVLILLIKYGSHSRRFWVWYSVRVAVVFFSKGRLNLRNSGSFLVPEILQCFFRVNEFYARILPPNYTSPQIILTALRKLQRHGKVIYPRQDRVVRLSDAKNVEIYM